MIMVARPVGAMGVRRKILSAEVRIPSTSLERNIITRPRETRNWLNSRREMVVAANV